MKKTNLMKIGFCAALLGGLALSPEAMAATSSLGDLADTVKSNIGAFKELIVSVAYLLGVFLFVGGLYMLYKDSKQPGQEHAKKGFIGIAIGTCLLLLPTMVNYVSGTLGGGDVSSTTLQNDADF